VVTHQGLTHRLNVAVGMGIHSNRKSWELVSGSARQWLHGGMQPALGYSKDLCCFGRGKCFVKAKNTAIVAVLPCALKCEGSLKATTIGLV